MSRYIPIFNSLSSEITRLIEAGAEKQMKRSLSYAPFRLFYSLLKKRNPNTIDQIRMNLSKDIKQTLSEIENFREEVFWHQHGVPTDQGFALIKSCFNIGIRILRDKLNVKLAFRLMREEALRQELYNHVLSEVRKAAIKHMPKQPPQNLPN